LKLASTSYLVSISSREQVAQIKGKPIYVITDVALIPLSSRTEAQNAINHARHALKQGKKEPLDVVESEDEDDTASSVTAEEDEDHGSVTSTPMSHSPPGSSKQAPLRKTSTVVSDVIQNKGSYGRFANRWFSKAGWKTEGRRQQGMSSGENLSMTKEQRKAAENALPDKESHEAEKAGAGATSDANEPASDSKHTSGDKPTPTSLDTIMQNLTPRILTTTKLFLSSRSFYFSYDYDISRDLARQESNTSSVALHKRFDPLVWRSHHLT